MFIEVGAHIPEARPELMFLLYSGIMGVYYLAQLLYIFPDTGSQYVFLGDLKLVGSTHSLFIFYSFKEIYDMCMHVCVCL